MALLLSKGHNANWCHMPKSGGRGETVEARADLTAWRTRFPICKMKEKKKKNIICPVKSLAMSTFFPDFPEERISFGSCQISSVQLNSGIIFFFF